MLPAQDRVNNGIQFLNDKLPGWQGRINLDILNIESFHGCVLGQLFGSFTIGVAELFEKPLTDDGEIVVDDVITERLISLGFDKGPKEDFGRLTNLWEDEVWSFQNRN